MDFLRAHAAKIAIAVVTLFVVLLLGEQLFVNRSRRMNMDISASTANQNPNEPMANSTGAPTSSSPEAALPTYGIEIIRTIPHDAHAFTEGILFHNGDLYESTGLHGQSSVRKLDPETGKLLKRLNIDAAYFGEGIVIVKDKLYQLTYQTGVGFVYDLKTFEQLRTFSYFGEGWGLTYDGEHIIMSDGTSSLRFLDPDSLLIHKMLTVTANGAPVKNLNELELIKGELWANVWQTDSIARINPATGKVTGWIDCSGLLTPEERSNADLLNGIAYDAKRDIILLAWKNCSKMFEVRVKMKEKM
jgi:glutamine cyclotransferase